MNNFIKRVLTAIVLIVVLLGAIFINKYTTLLVALLFSNVSIYELNNVLKKINFGSNELLAFIFNTIFILAAFKLNQKVIFPIYTLYIIVLFIILILDENGNFASMLSNIFIATYLTMPYAYLILLNDKKWIFYAFAISAFTDTFAYLVGMTMGKHKLIPRVSPKKTIEGAIGGVLGAVLFTYLFKIIFNLEHSFLMYISAIVISIVSQFGDLLASYIKRKADVKDYGNILVGHGGILDRFDSLLLVAPLVYILVYNLR